MRTGTCVLLPRLDLNELLPTVTDIFKPNHSHSFDQGHVVDEVMLKAEDDLHRLLGIEGALDVNGAQSVLESLCNHFPLLTGAPPVLRYLFHYLTTTTEEF